MKTYQFIFVLLLFYLVVSCGKNTNEKNNLFSEETQSECTDLSHPEYPFQDTVKIKCVNLTLSVLDQDDEIIPNCTATVFFIGKGVVKDHAVDTVLNSEAKTTLPIYAENKSFQLQIHNDHRLILHTFNFKDGINKDTEIVYKLVDCKK